MASSSKKRAPAADAGRIEYHEIPGGSHSGILGAQGGAIFAGRTAAALPKG